MPHYYIPIMFNFTLHVCTIFHIAGVGAPPLNTTSGLLTPHEAPKLSSGLLNLCLQLHLSLRRHQSFTTLVLISKRLPVSRQGLQMRHRLATCAWLQNTCSTVGYLRLLAPADITEQLITLNPGKSVNRTDLMYRN